MKDGPVQKSTKNTRMSATCAIEAGKAQGLSFDLITSGEELRGFEAAWRDLEKRDQSRFTYFQTYDWCARWFEIFGDNDPFPDNPQLRVFVATKRGKTMLIWPMMLEPRGMGLNTLISLSEPHGQLSNVLADPEIDADAAINACWEHMCRLPGIDVIELPNVPATSTLGQALLSEEEIAASENACSIMDLTVFDGWEGYQKSLSSGTRRNRRRKRKKLSDMGELKFSVHEAGSDEYQRLVTQSLKFKQQWLNELGKASRALSMDGTREFLQGLQDAPDGSARCYAGSLTLGDRMIACEFGFERHGHYIGYLGAFDWDLAAHSPGKLEMEEMLGWCMAQEFEWFDLLGNASTYKDDWSNMSVPLVDLHVGLTTLGKAHATLWSKRLRPALKGAIESLSGDHRKFLMSKIGAHLSSGKSKN